MRKRWPIQTDSFIDYPAGLSKIAIMNDCSQILDNTTWGYEGFATSPTRDTDFNIEMPIQGLDIDLGEEEDVNINYMELEDNFLKPKEFADFGNMELNIKNVGKCVVHSQIGNRWHVQNLEKGIMSITSNFQGLELGCQYQLRCTLVRKNLEFQEIPVGGVCSNAKHRSLLNGRDDHIMQPANVPHQAKRVRYDNNNNLRSLVFETGAPSINLELEATCMITFICSDYCVTHQCKEASRDLYLIVELETKNEGVGHVVARRKVEVWPKAVAHRDLDKGDRRKTKGPLSHKRRKQSGDEEASSTDDNNKVVDSTEELIDKHVERIVNDLKSNGLSTKDKNDLQHEIKEKIYTCL